SRRARPGHGTRDGHLQRLPRPAPAGDVLRAPARQGTRPAHRLGDSTGSPALSAPVTTVSATAAASGPVAAKMVTTQMISPAVCAVTMLACRAAAAWLAVTA